MLKKEKLEDDKKNGKDGVLAYLKSRRRRWSWELEAGHPRSER